MFILPPMGTLLQLYLFLRRSYFFLLTESCHTPTDDYLIQNNKFNLKNQFFGFNYNRYLQKGDKVFFSFWCTELPNMSINAKFFLIKNIYSQKSFVWNYILTLKTNYNQWCFYYKSDSRSYAAGKHVEMIRINTCFEIRHLIYFRFTI